MVSVKIEAWLWYGVVAATLVMRYIARYMHFKDIRKFQFEDYFMLFVFALYTVLIEMLVICAKVSTNLIDPRDIPKLTPKDIADRVYGSKCVLVAESCMCAVQWGTKVTLLLLYWRLTENLRQAILVKIAAGYVLVTYLVMISLYYGYWCRPFHYFWEVPVANTQCATQTHHLILNLTFNLSSDLLILAIPFPLFLKAKLEWRKKVLLIFPFALGTFTMVCAILSKNLSFTKPFSGEWVYWYTREASTAMIVTNMPYSWTIIRKVFRLKSFITGHGSSNDGTRGTGPTGTRSTGLNTQNGEKSRKLKLFSRRDKSIQQLPSHTDSITGPQNEDDAPRAIDWARKSQKFELKDIVIKMDPASSSSSDASTTRKVSDATQRNTMTYGVSDVDRLYQTDDFALERSISNAELERAVDVESGTVNKS